MRCIGGGVFAVEPAALESFRLPSAYVGMTVVAAVEVEYRSEGRRVSRDPDPESFPGTRLPGRVGR